MDIHRNMRGFTLAELLIVVAIIAVLVAIAIPVFTSSLEKARAATCLANRTSLQHMLTYGAMMDKEAFSKVSDGDTWDKVKPILEATGNSMGEEICPSKGIITIHKITNSESSSTFTVSCGKHGSSSGDSTSPNASAQTFLQSVISHITDNSANDSYKNDKVRESYFKQNGDSWPTFTYDGAIYQIEPFYAENKEKNAQNTWLFARKGDGSVLVKGNWNGDMVYDPIADQWYIHLHNYNGQPSSTSINFNNSLETLHTTVQNDAKQWKPITVTYNK